MLVFSTQLYKGSLLTNGTAVTTNTPLRWNGKRYALLHNGTSHSSTIATTAFGTLPFSVSILAKVGAIGASRSLIGGAANGFELYISSTGYLTAVKYGGSALTASTTLLKSGVEYVLGYIKSGTTGTYYVNGVAAGTTTDTNDYTVSSSLIGNGTGFFNGSISSVRIFNHALTTSEITAEYNYSLSLRGTNNLIRNIQTIKPTDLSRQKPSLVAAYNMVPSKGVLVDISGNGNNLTSVGGVVRTRSGVSLNGVNGYYFRDIASNMTLGTDSVSFSARVTIQAMNVSYIVGIGNNSNGAAAVLGINASGGIRLSCFVAPLIETTTNPLSIGRSYTINAVLTGGNVSFYVNGIFLETKACNYNISGTKLYVGAQLNIGSFFSGEIEDVRIHKKALSAKEVKDYHNQFIKVLLQANFQSDPADGTAITPVGWIKGTGVYKVSEATASDAVLKTIQKGTKYLEYTTAGTIAIENNAAYGTFEWDWYKGGGNNYSDFFITSNRYDLTNSGYLLEVGAAENVLLYRMTGGSPTSLASSAGAYITNNTWYRIKITRSSSGVFTILIKGGVFTATAGYDGWTLVSVTSGTNPVTENTHTTSNYFVLDIDAGDRFTNLTIYDGIKV